MMSLEKNISVYSISYDECIYSTHNKIDKICLMNMQLSQGFPSAHSLEGRHLHDRQSSTLSSHGLFRTLGRRDFFAAQEVAMIGS